MHAIDSRAPRPFASSLDAPVAPRARLAEQIRTTGKKIDYYKRNALARRMRLLERLEIDLVLDVGANTGQYAMGLRRAGYRGQIVSFEPLADAFARLARRADRDRRWTAIPLALGDADTSAVIHVSGDSRASSLRAMLPRSQEIAAYFAPVADERVEVRRLDSAWPELVPARSHVFLKLDTQGFEREVLAGAARSLQHVRGVQMEMSLEPLYQGEPPLSDMLDLMHGYGFRLVSLEYGFCDPESGEMLQVDGIFVRSPVAAARR